MIPRWFAPLRWFTSVLPDIIGRRRSMINHFSIDQEQLRLAGETFFNRMVCLERRRSERTGNPFALMLVNVEPLAHDLDTRGIENMAAALASTTRDTDTTGWYKCYSTIGVIFTSLNGTSRETVRSVILDRVYKAFRARLDPNQVQKIAISIHFFPEETTAKKDSTSSDETLYPDLHPESGILYIDLKRLLDIAGSLCSLILLSPVFLIISALIKLTSHGPVFFRQRRLGKLGREFIFLKFGSMYADND